MDLHEYQAKELLAEKGIAIPPMALIRSFADIERAFEKFQTPELIFKAQIHAGGRGKAGGVKRARRGDEAATLVRSLLAHRLTTAQSPPEGLPIHTLIASPPVEIKKEYYIAVTLDRKRATPILIASREGGVDIEEVAQRNPKALGLFPIVRDGRIRGYELQALVRFMGWQGRTKEEGIALAKAMAEAYIQNDARLIEINPLIETIEGQLIALDAKISLDDNALYRHKKLSSLFDPSQLAENEAKAFEANLSYVSLDGEIGCLVNGAGLAMATMDLLKCYGGKPANFLDIGGSATSETIAFGFQLILLDPKVRALFINIFGGIVDCALLAQAILDATRVVHPRVPLVVRLEGNRSEEGRRLLLQSSLQLTVVDDFAEAAERVCKEARRE